MLGDRFRSAVSSAGYTLSSFARRMEESRQTVDGWMHRGIPPRRCFRIGRVLSVNPEWLIISSCDDRELGSPMLERFLENFPASQSQALREIIGSFQRRH